MIKRGITEFGITSNYYDDECVRVILYLNKKTYKHFFFRKSFSDAKFEEIYQFFRTTLAKNDGMAFWKKLEALPDFKAHLRQAKLIEPLFFTVGYGAGTSNGKTNREAEYGIKVPNKNSVGIVLNKTGTPNKNTSGKTDKKTKDVKTPLVKFRIKAERSDDSLRVHLFINSTPYQFYTFYKNMPGRVFYDVYNNKLGKKLKGTEFWEILDKQYQKYFRNCESFSLEHEEKTNKVFHLSTKPVRAKKSPYRDSLDPYSWTENVYRPGTGTIGKR